LPAAIAACVAAYGVPLRDPLKPIAPALDQAITCPSASVIVTIVLLNVAFTWMSALLTARLIFLTRGAVAVAAEEDWELLKSLSNQGRTDSGEWLTHGHLGINYRLDDVSAALGLAQLEKLGAILELRADVAAPYGALTQPPDGVEAPPPDDEDLVRSWYLYVVRLAAEADRDPALAGPAPGASSGPVIATS